MSAQGVNAESPSLQVGIGKLAYAARGSMTCLAVGSCVALCLLNEATGHAGMAHVFLPKAPKHTDIPPADAGRYADTAVAEMARALCPVSLGKGRLIAFVAGGARMFTKGFQGSNIDVGRMNINAVLSMLVRHGIEISDTDLGGTSARNVRVEIEARRMITYSGSWSEALAAAPHQRKESAR